MVKSTLYRLSFVLLTSLYIVSCGAKYTSDDSSRSVNESRVVQATALPTLKKLVDSLKINKNDLQLKIYKSLYKMDVVYEKKVIKTYAVVFGFNPFDDKLKQGDGCTPEGEFGIRAKYPHSSWSKFIWIDYPTKASWEKHTKAKRDGTISKKASIGGEVGIHGVPAGYDYIIDERQNWTLGCISLKNKDIDDLYESVGTKTRIQIFH